MSLTLDHVVILVHDLQAAVRDYTSLGFTVQQGGTHADGHTHNALIGFADGSYLEIIAFLHAHPAHRWGGYAARGHEGFVDYALLPASVAAVVAGARDRGLAYEGPIDGGRVRPDGQRLAWQIGTPPSPDLPFLCGDITPRALRVREGEVRVHANGVTGVAAVTVAVADLEASLQRYAALGGPEATRPAATVSATGLGLRLATVKLGATDLVLAADGPDAGDEAPLAKALSGRSQGVIGLTLRGPGPRRGLPAAQTAGAALTIQPD